MEYPKSYQTVKIAYDEALLQSRWPGRRSDIAPLLDGVAGLNRRQRSYLDPTPIAMIRMNPKEGPAEFCDRVLSVEPDLYLCPPGAPEEETLSKLGVATAAVHSPRIEDAVSHVQLRVAFDGDAVLFTDTYEQLYRQHGLTTFQQHELARQHEPMAGGPLKNLMVKLGALHREMKDQNHPACPLRLSLITARGGKAAFRMLNTLQSWGVFMDEWVFTSGAPKTAALMGMRPHIFFDDKMLHVNEGVAAGVTSCHINYDFWSRGQNFPTSVPK